MTKFQIQKASSTVNWTGKKVLGLHTGSINIASGFIEIIDDTIVGGEILIEAFHCQIIQLIFRDY